MLYELNLIFFGKINQSSLSVSSYPTDGSPSPPPTRPRICRMPPSTATTTVAWRSQRPPAPSRRRGRGSDRWLCQRTTTREPLLTAASERWNTRRTVRAGGVSPPFSFFHLLHHPSIHPERSRDTITSCFHLHTLLHIHLTPTFNQTPTIPCAVCTSITEAGSHRQTTQSACNIIRSDVFTN